MGPDSLVLTIQNGLGAGERIAEHLPTDNVLLGVAEGFGASMTGPGHAHHNGMRLIRVGELNGGLTERLEMLVELWRGAGFDMATGCTREVYAIGQAMGINFSFDDPVAYVTEFASTLRNAEPLMLQDRLAEQPSDIDAINGMVPVLGQRVGIATPYNETVTAVVRAIEGWWSRTT